MSDNAFIRESGRPDAIEKAIQTLEALMMNLENRLAWEVASQEPAKDEEEWIKWWRKLEDREFNPFAEIPIKFFPLWAQNAYYQITDLQKFVYLVERAFSQWQGQCDAYYQQGVRAGRKLERFFNDDHPDGTSYFSN